MIYLDNAATSWPKPPDTWRAMEHFMREIGANPGRSGHRLAVDAARVLFDAREALAELFAVTDPLRIVLLRNATEALNLALFGLLRSGDHVITSSLEHNSVMRPLRALEQDGVQLTVIPCAPDGSLDPGEVKQAIRSNTKLIVLTHASNVLGTVLPVAEVGMLAREHEILFCVDAAQTAGAYPIDVDDMHIDFLAFTGHKSLLGPQGTGGLYIRQGIEDLLTPLVRGGTGSRSEWELQPDFMPDKYESGTPNTVGFAGLAAGVRFVLAHTVRRIRQKEKKLTQQLIDGLSSIPRVTCFGTRDADTQIAVVSFTIDGATVSEVAMVLDETYGILTRPGLHCAPSTHRTLGTFPEGTVRFAPGCFSSEDDVAAALSAVTSIASGPHERGMVYVQDR
jgi:cysteine desulfurase family protein